MSVNAEVLAELLGKTTQDAAPKTELESNATNVGSFSLNGGSLSLNGGSTHPLSSPSTVTVTLGSQLTLGNGTYKIQKLDALNAANPEPNLDRKEIAEFNSRTADLTPRSMVMD